MNYSYTGRFKFNLELITIELTIELARKSTNSGLEAVVNHEDKTHFHVILGINGPRFLVFTSELTRFRTGLHLKGIPLQRLKNINFRCPFLDCNEPQVLHTITKKNYFCFLFGRGLKEG